MSLRMSFSRAVCGVPPSGPILACVVLLVLSAGCKLFESTCKPDDRKCLGGGLLRSGQVCVRTGDCGEGLTCTKGVCAYAATTKRGDQCFVTSECAKGLYCSTTNLQCTAIAENPKTVGEECGSTADCVQGLMCDIDVDDLFTHGPYGLVSDECREKLTDEEAPDQCKLPKACRVRGKTELGEECKKSEDCLAGLFCGPSPLTLMHENICIGGVKLSIEPVSIPFWNGQECPDDATKPTAYFEVPRGTSVDKDFYRLPFPNDIRHRDGSVDLSTHPRPTKDLQPPAAVQFIDGAASLDGFATNPVVYFRFSQALQNSDLSLKTVRIVDITRSSPDYGAAASIAWGPSEVASNYICPHWLSLYRPLGSPLRPNTTYAALVSRGVRARDGSEFTRSPDFDSMLSPDRPRDAMLALAWEDYAPLRDYLNTGGSELTSDELLNAAVFTTQDATAIVPKLRAAAEQDGKPALSDLTVCGTGVHSPCEDDTGRGACHADNDSFVEIHGHVALPIFQSGKIPYETAADGGEITLDGGGKPTVQGHASVCIALSIPKAAAPAAGYPVLIVAHGTGGAFSDAMGSSGLSKLAAEAETPSVVIAIDLPSHGSRRGTSTRPPEDLFFNFTNPKAARGNAIQGAADLMSLTLLIADGIAGSDSPTKQTIAFDKSRVVMFAHSQGATHTALMIGYESRVSAALLSGVGGHLATSLRLKQKPVDLGAVLPFALFDPDIEEDSSTAGKLAGEEVNPMLALVQSYMESADPINYARYLQSDVPSSAPDGHDVFVTYGLFDNYAPEKTQAAYVQAGALPAVDPDLTRQFVVVSPPVRGNFTPGSKARTVAVRTYDPIADAVDPSMPQDGHFVATQTKKGVVDVRRFLTQALNGETPQVGP